MEFQFVRRRILLALRLREFLPDALFDLVVELVVFVRRDHAFIDQLLFPSLERIAFLEVLEFLGAAIEFLVVAARVAGKAFHLHPQKAGPFSGAQSLDRFARHVVNGLDIRPVDFDPVVRLKHAQRERIDLPRRTADAVTVVLHHEHHRQLPLLRKANRLEKIPLARRRIADGRDDEVWFAIEFDAPGDAAGGEKLRAGRGRHAPDVAIGVTVMRWHLAPAALALALRHVIERQLARRDAATEHQRAIAIVGDDVIARLHLERDRRQRLVAHAGNVEMPFALPVQVLLAQISVPALEDRGQQSEFIFLAQRGHLGRERCSGVCVKRRTKTTRLNSSVSL